MDEKRELLQIYEPYVDSEESTSSSMKSRDSVEMPDEEFDEKAPLNLADEEGREQPVEAKRPSKLIFWIIVNIVATIAIVFVNKSVFSDPLFRNVQVSFAAFHFVLTHVTLQIMSTRTFAVFERRQLRVLEIMPLAASMCLSVVFQNTSLAFCSVPFYQTARVLLTPVTAGLNFMLYRSTIPRQAAVMLIPTCAGVGIMAYFDTKNGSGSGSSHTSPIGAAFALTGVVTSAIYTIWVARYHKKLDMSSPQLLHQQSLAGGALLMCLIPFFDKLPHYSAVSTERWLYIALSGACAILINLSQFTIISGAGPVASTVVGHGKTLCIITLGWIMSGKSVSDSSLIGTAIAVFGIIAYSAATMHYGRK